MTPAQRFRALVADPKILQLPACHDGLSARVLEQAGFQAIAAAGFGHSGSLLGMPDIGLLSGREMIDQYRNLCAAVSIPVFVDIDTGFGDLNNVIRTVREVEATGAAGLFIEDQTYPKRCGHMQGKQVVPVEEYLPKLKAALWTRRDPDFVIMARTDAYSVLGLDEALRRARLYAQAGADMVFVEAVDDPDAMHTVNQTLGSLGVPSMANMIEGGRGPFLSTAELQDLGYDLVAYPCGSLFSAVKAMQDWAGALLHQGTTTAVRERMLGFDGYTRFIGLEELRERQVRLESETGGSSPH
ncbi:isocitrate lyase/PEP mutase family protein [Thiorhodovibrio frisius]|uniref:PEP phosphonomutase-like enzyme n=1 Tax=Thiorhodovibrio frisius TaxID=631362 RepID=H8YYX6_9GAMM|nr:oxaloacetate decarboxylase [Thiorhodovibrio frisius]EIC23652.1 PEP phosphonomutase-like enzyme [Thiorhodovibrio frisius]WPL23255.1 2,3-dimethylmalate lyase [Thiorhodovibrio frisius]